MFHIYFRKQSDEKKEKQLVNFDYHFDYHNVNSLLLVPSLRQQLVLVLSLSSYRNTTFNQSALVFS